MASRSIGLKTACLAMAGVAVAGACGLLVLEIGIRLLHPEATRPYLVAWLERERATWARPDSEFHHVGDGIFHLAFPVSSDSTKPRIMIIGDSFAMGHIVGETNRFGTLLQRDLGTRATVDVLATSSYSPVIYRNVVRKALGLAHYDVVAVFVDQTDPADELIYEQDLLGHNSSWTFDLPQMRQGTRVVQDSYDRLLRDVARWNSPRRLATLNFFKPLSLRDVIPPGDGESQHPRLTEVDQAELVRQFNLQPDAFESRVMRRLLLEHLDQIVALCQASHVALVLTANPWEVQSARHPRVRYGFPGPYPIENQLEALLVERYGRRPGVFVMRMTEAFRTHGDPSSLFVMRSDNDFHWNEQGHAFVEALLRSFLLNEVHVPGPLASADPEQHDAWRWTRRRVAGVVPLDRD